MNGIDMNGIDMNGIDMNGIDMNGIDMNGISHASIEFKSGMHWGSSHDGIEHAGYEFADKETEKEYRVDFVMKLRDMSTIAEKKRRQFITYWTRCAFEPGQYAGFVDVDGTGFVVEGNVGLFPDWGHGVLGDPYYQTWACIGAKINSDGPRAISIRGVYSRTGHDIPGTAIEKTKFPVAETFIGAGPSGKKGGVILYLGVNDIMSAPNLELADFRACSRDCVETCADALGTTYCPDEPDPLRCRSCPMEFIGEAGHACSSLNGNLGYQGCSYFDASTKKNVAIPNVLTVFVQ
jgi:hypothetical protein